MLKLEIVTPEKRVLDAEVESVTVPTASGEVGILPDHASLISALRPGIVEYSIKGVDTRLAVSGGFVEVNSNKVAVLADTAEAADEIDAQTARAARDEAERAMAAAVSPSAEDAERFRERLDAASARLQVAGGK